jgi:radical SAM-linked protein
LSRVVQNIRVRFSKQGDIRFTSHHDMMRLFERALRRADLPVAMSEGFNPRPRISLPMALSVGISGLSEVADVGLREWVKPEDFRRRLGHELPEGIEVVSARSTPPNIARQPRHLAYRVPLRPGHCLSEEKLAELLRRDTVTVSRLRKNAVKEVEIRRYIRTLRLEADTLYILLDYSQEGTARPEEVLASLGCVPGVDYGRSEIERTSVNLAS